MAILLYTGYQHQYSKAKAEKKEGKTHQASNYVLDICIGSAAALAAEIVEPRYPVHKVVDDSNDYGHSNGITPNQYGSDNAGTAIGFEMGPVARSRFVAWAREPTENAK